MGARERYRPPQTLSPHGLPPGGLILCRLSVPGVVAVANTSGLPDTRSTPLPGHDPMRIAYLTGVCDRAICAWFGGAERSAYCKPGKSELKVLEQLCRIYSQDDPARAILPLSHYCWPARVQQEQGSADLPHQRLAGQEASHCFLSQDEGRAFGSSRTRPAPGNRSVSHLDRA